VVFLMGGVIGRTWDSGLGGHRAPALFLCGQPPAGHAPGPDLVHPWLAGVELPNSTGSPLLHRLMPISVPRSGRSGLRSFYTPTTRIRWCRLAGVLLWAPRRLCRR